MHHAAAALNVPGVIIFGGYTPLELTGYPMHINLAGDAENACGSLYRCDHCRQALDSISVAEVLQHTFGLLHEHKRMRG
jgi:hypothetical protein